MSFVRGKVRMGVFCLSCGWLANVAVFMLNLVSAGSVPLGNFYHVFTTLALLFPLAYAAAARRQFGWSGAYFSAGAAVCLATTFGMKQGLSWKPSPALASPWFVPHVASYLVSYAFAGMACCLTVAARRLERAGRSSDGHRRLSAAMIRAAFPCMTFGLASGAAWADAAWGSYWSWDPKETGALAVWLLYAAWFHICRVRRLRRLADAVHLAAFLALLMTFLGVALLPKIASRLHGYA